MGAFAVVALSLLLIEGGIRNGRRSVFDGGSNKGDAWEQRHGLAQ